MLRKLEATSLNLGRIRLKILQVRLGVMQLG